MQRKEIEAQLIGEKEFKNYKNFALKDDMFKLAIGVILGNSFNKVVYGVSDYLIMPVFTFLISKTGQQWRQWEFSPFFGLTFELGHLLGTFIDFLLVSIILYLFYIKLIQKVIIKNEQPILKECKFCLSKINSNAIKCPMCTGDLVEKRRARRKNQRRKNNRSQ